MRRFLGDNQGHVSIVTSFGGAGAAAGGVTTTFAQYYADTSGSTTILQDTAPNFVGAISFVASTSGTIDYVEAELYRDNFSMTGQVHAGITTDNSGAPLAVPSIMGSREVAEFGNSVANASMTSFSFSTGYTVTASTTYWLVFFHTMTSALSKQVKGRGYNANNNPNSEFRYSSNYGSSWTSLGSFDLNFLIRGLS